MLLSGCEVTRLDLSSSYDQPPFILCLLEMGGPPKKKKEVPAAQMTPTPARAAQRSPAPEKTPLESPAPGKAVKRKPPTPQTVPSPGRQRAPYPEKEQGTPSTDDTGRRRAKTSQNIVPFGHGSMVTFTSFSSFPLSNFSGNS